MENKMIAKIVGKLESINALGSLILPSNKLDEHPFDFFEDKFSGVVEELNKLEVFLQNKVDTLIIENSELKNRIENYKKQLGIRNFSDVSEKSEENKYFLNADLNLLEKDDKQNEMLLIEKKCLC
ncbi:hypothetical protein EDEG_03187 [Edhazardia aedis USNM 41457]|uniref:Uncharacterized protein n=1 Tax=Edhazardia aedis (strain USNM 41457) TaxID=1003232 RepID=J8ZRR2_EDHAE|nr:hypothetical protein EDEG_03187 [Edhazardia aedis USNM 41457]|eukprot:EJW02383.1 hypothetical protein EDEG_03187 [Edhazardia aedis USNM 41457]